MKISEKIWKTFGVFGMICFTILVIVFLILVKESLEVRPQQQLPQGKSPATEYELQYLSPRSSVTLPEKLSQLFPREKESKTIFQTQAETPSRMIIKTGWLNLVVKDVVDVAKKIAEYAEKSGGWVVYSNISERETIPSGTITVRVPAEKFEQAKEYFRSLAVRVTNESVQSQDITEEYTDLQARLRNLEATENQLLEIMKKAGTISETLDVFEQLTNIREQIERIKGKMEYLEQSVKMSSITVNLALSEELLPIPPSEKWRPKYVLLQTWKNVLNFWKEFSYFIIRVVVWAQVWIPALIIFWYGRKIYKKIRKKE